MEQFGLLFKNGIVTKNDMDFLHTMPNEIGIQALWEFSKNNMCNVYIPSNTHTFSKYKNILRKIKDTTNYTNKVKILSRVRDMIESFLYTVFDSKYTKEIFLYIERPVYDIDKFKDLFIKIIELLTKLNLSIHNMDTFDFIIKDLIPMKIEDYYYSHKRVNFIPENESNYLGKLWDNIAKNYYEKNEETLEDDLNTLTQLLLLSEEDITKLYTAFGLKYKKSFIKDYVNLNTTLYKAYTILSDTDKEYIGELRSYVYPSMHTFVMSDKDVANLVNSSDLFSTLSLYVPYPVTNWSDVILIGKLKNLNVWSIIFKTSEYIYYVYKDHDVVTCKKITKLNDDIKVKLI